jgi:hypothetical protein
MAAISVFPYLPFACRAEGFNGILLSFFHSVLIVTFHNWHTLACVNMITSNTVTTKIFYALHRISLASNFNLVGLHSFLNCLSNFSKSRIDSSVSNSSVSRIFDCHEQIVVGGIERNCECTIRHDSSDMASVINFHYIIVLKHSFVTDVRRPVSCAVIETGPCWKSNSCIQTTCFNQTSVCCFNLIADVHNFHAWLDKLLSPFSCLAMYFSRASQSVVVRFMDHFFGSQLSACDPVSIVFSIVFLDLTDRERA